MITIIQQGVFTVTKSGTYSENKSILKVNDLKKYFPIKKGLFSRIAGYIKAVDGVFLDGENKLIGKCFGGDINDP